MEERSITRTTRRTVLAGIAASASFAALAQQPALGLPLVAVLWASRAEAERDFDAALRSGLKDGGFVEGTNFAFAMRYADGDFKRVAPLAAELAALKPSVIVASPDEVTLAAHHAAPTVPLVMSGLVGDPVALGLAQSYARPGGMATGVTTTAGGGMEAIIGKRMALLKELVPGLARIGVILITDTARFATKQNGTNEAAKRLGLDVVSLPVRTLGDVETAFASGVRAGAGAFYVDSGPVTMNDRAKVAEFAFRAGKPTVGQVIEQARAGLLMSYAANIADGWRRAGVYVAKILAGAKPGDLPIEQASKFTFVINLKTAKALGLTVPPRLLLLADEVVE